MIIILYYLDRLNLVVSRCTYLRKHLKIIYETQSSTYTNLYIHYYVILSKSIMS